MIQLANWWDAEVPRGALLEVIYLLEGGGCTTQELWDLIDQRPGLTLRRAESRHVSGQVYAARVLVLDAGRLGPRLGRFLGCERGQAKVMHVFVEPATVGSTAIATAGAVIEGSWIQEQAAKGVQRVGNDVATIRDGALGALVPDLNLGGEISPAIIAAGGLIALALAIGTRPRRRST